MNSKGDVVDERLLIRYMYIHIFYGASALFCTPSRRLRDDADVGRRRANDRFAIFLPSLKSRKFLPDAIKARYNRVFGGATPKAQKAHVAMEWEPVYEEAFHCVLVVCTHTIRI